jgi:hypothetical protein
MVYLWTRRPGPANFHLHLHQPRTSLGPALCHVLAEAVGISDKQLPICWMVFVQRRTLPHYSIYGLDSMRVKGRSRTTLIEIS